MEKCTPPSSSIHARSPPPPSTPSPVISAASKSPLKTSSPPPSTASPTPKRILNCRVRLAAPLVGCASAHLRTWRLNEDNYLSDHASLDESPRPRRRLESRHPHRHLLRRPHHVPPGRPANERRQLQRRLVQRNPARHAQALRLARHGPRRPLKPHCPGQTR